MLIENITCLLYTSSKALDQPADIRRFHRKSEQICQNVLVLLIVKLQGGYGFLQRTGGNSSGNDIGESPGQKYYCGYDGQICQQNAEQTRAFQFQRQPLHVGVDVYKRQPPTEEFTAATITDIRLHCWRNMTPCRKSDMPAVTVSAGPSAFWRGLP